MCVNKYVECKAYRRPKVGFVVGIKLQPSTSVRGASSRTAAPPAAALPPRDHHCLIHHIFPNTMTR
ncbi:hypothetical protein E2C01_001759 [Portunus trituberculatus]|uniref:Uncharacterized protein n=1 Tax=Portunus trituberculatus TaxID=210409 RepID=A0A5B7CI33_PORTR|nr:hypothetical protein [Portunus trituberculatus]